MPGPTRSVTDVVSGVRAAQPRALGRAITWVEESAAELPALMAALASEVGQRHRIGSGAHIIGITGPPGVGKSTTTSALVSWWRAQGLRVAVLAIDPSSPFSGGALLGDRIRMQAHALDAGVFIRSMASRGHLGGLSVATPQALRVLEAAGFDVLVVETVGVGQSEVDIAAQSDSTVVLMAPGMGDGVQAAKAGIMEIGDLYVVNKADRTGARQVTSELRAVLAMSQRRVDSWSPPVLKTVAAVGEGIDRVGDALSDHWAYVQEHGRLERIRRQRAANEIEAIALMTLSRRWRAGQQAGALAALTDDVAAGSLDPYAAAARLAAPGGDIW